MENKNILKNEFGLKEFFAGIYKWMTAGFVISAIFAYLSIYTNYLNFIFENQFYFYGLIAIQLILALGVQFMIRKLSPSTASILFFIYSGITGILISGLLRLVDIQAVLMIFLGAVLIYGILALIGFNTEKDISGWGKPLFIAVIVIILVSIINIFLGNKLLDIIVTIISLIVFALLAVYDHQAYKNIYYEVKDNQEEVERYTILGALQMYITLIVIFQDLLKLYYYSEDE